MGFYFQFINETNHKMRGQVVVWSDLGIRGRLGTSRRICQTGHRAPKNAPGANFEGRILEIGPKGHGKSSPGHVVNLIHINSM